MKIAIIPARSGSKRIPGKNIKHFAGRPLLEYPISAAHKSGLFERVIVSTDSQEIADLSVLLGAEVPFVRPSELASDDTATLPVIKHAVKILQSQGVMVDYCCCIYANPFVEASDIIQSFDVLIANGATSVLPVTTYESPIFKAVTINRFGALEAVFDGMGSARTQDMAITYHDAGQFYWWNCEHLMSIDDLNKLRSMNRYPLVISRSRVQDIDTTEDWDIAEFLYAWRESHY